MITESTPMTNIILMIFFAFYSVAGWLAEKIYRRIKTGRKSNPGFLRGPYEPMYGVMAIVTNALLSTLRDEVAYLFLISFVVATLTELATGILLETIKGKKDWDYTGRIGSIRGYTCMVHTMKVTLFLVAALVIVQPIFEIIVWITPAWVDLVILAVFYVFFTSDLVDALAEGIAEGKNERAKNRDYD